MMLTCNYTSLQEDVEQYELGLALKTLKKGSIIKKRNKHLVPRCSSQESQIREMSTQRAEHSAFCHLFPNIIFSSRVSMWSVLLTADPPSQHTAGTDSLAL